jgi:hypothetical protein
MAFEKGHKKLGGRKKGMLNKKTLIKADDLLLELGVNPIQKLIEIAESDLASVDQKINCYKEIAKYTYPKSKSQDIRVESYSQYPDLIKVEVVSVSKNA